MFALSMAYVCVTSVVVIFNLFTKISAHGGGIAGPITALFFVFSWNAAPFLILLPIIAWSRIKLKAHTPLQIVAGMIISIIVTFCVYSAIL